jgi:hypothetical protein
VTGRWRDREQRERSGSFKFTAKQLNTNREKEAEGGSTRPEVVDEEHIVGGRRRSGRDEGTGHTD